MESLRSLSPPPSRSPWLAPPVAKAADAPPSGPTDAVSLGMHPAVAPPPPTASRAPLGRSLLLGVLTAASIVGGAIGATVVTRTAAPGVQASMSVMPASAARPVAPRATDRAAVIDAMLTPMNAAVTPSASDMRKARATLESLPAPVLQLLGANGTRIVILKPGQTPDDAGLIRPVDVAAYGDAALATRAADALSRVDGLYVNRINALRGEVDTAPAVRQASLRGRLDGLQTERSLVARRVVMEATDALLEPADDLHVGVDGRIAPAALHSLAEQHGARTPAEVREFTSLLERLNQAPLSRVLVPAFEYSREGDTGPSERLLSHDLESLQSWEAEDATGQYFYRDSLNAVVVRADQLQAPGAPHNVLRHELGHAFEDARRTLQPGAGYSAEREAAFGRIASIPAHPYRGTHAAEGPDEMAAETFSNVMSGNDAALRHTDAAWLQAFETWRAPNP